MDLEKVTVEQYLEGVLRKREQKRHRINRLRMELAHIDRVIKHAQKYLKEKQDPRPGRGRFPG